MLYTDMSTEEGREFLPKVWNLFFKPLTREDFFVSPFGNHKFRDCAEFRLGSGGTQSDEIFFFINDEDLVQFLKETTGELYLFGAYNQVNVCQMRARGTVKFEGEHLETEEIKKRLADIVRSRINVSINKLDRDEVEERLKILRDGLLFSFHINSYAYSTYERG